MMTLTEACEGIAFQSSGAQINDLNEITAATSPIGITIDGHEVREPDGPKGLPYVGYVTLSKF